MEISLAGTWYHKLPYWDSWWSLHTELLDIIGLRNNVMSTESAVIFLRQPFDGPFLSLSPPPDKMWYLLLFMYLVRALHSLRLFISAGWSGRTDGLHRSTQFIKAKYDETKTLSVNTCEPQTTCSQMEVSPLKNGLIGIGIGLCLCAIFWRLSGGVPACLITGLASFADMNLEERAPISTSRQIQ